jgi:hypothetical protein
MWSKLGLTRAAGAAVTFHLCAWAAQPKLDWSVPSGRAQSYFEGERYDSAAVLGSEALAALRASRDRTDSIEVTLLLQAAEYFRERALFDTAQLLLSQADSLCKAMNPAMSRLSSHRVIALAELTLK